VRKELFRLARTAGLAILLAAAVSGQATLAPPPKFTGLDNNGNPIVGGLLYSYVAGTTTPLATYTSSSASVANSNPVILDGAGRADIWLSSSSLYKLELRTAQGAVVWTVDNVSGSGGGGGGGTQPWVISGSDIYYSAGNVGVGGAPTTGQKLQVTGNEIVTGYLRFRDQAATAHYVGFSAPNSATADVTWKLPSQSQAGCWTDDGAGNLSIQTCGSGGGGTGTPYTTTVTSATSLTVLALTHGQGTLPVAYCFDSATPRLAVLCSYTRNTSGDLVFSFNPPFTGLVQIESKGTGGGGSSMWTLDANNNVFLSSTNYAVSSLKLKNQTAGTGVTSLTIQDGASQSGNSVVDFLDNAGTRTAYFAGGGLYTVNGGSVKTLTQALTYNMSSDAYILWYSGVNLASFPVADTQLFRSAASTLRIGDNMGGNGNLIVGNLTVNGTCTGCGSGGGLPVVDTTSVVKGSTDATKLLRFEVDGFTTATTRTLTPQDASYTIAGTDIAQTFSQVQTHTASLAGDAVADVGQALASKYFRDGNFGRTVDAAFLRTQLGTPDAPTDFFDWTMGQGIGGVQHVVGLRNSSGQYVLNIDDRRNAGDPTLFQFLGHIQPQTTNAYDIGSSALRIRKIYATDLDVTGTCSGCGAGGGLPVPDTTDIVRGNLDATKLLRFEVDGFSTATERTLTPQNASYIIAGTNITNSFTSQQNFGATASLAGATTNDVGLNSGGAAYFRNGNFGGTVDAGFLRTQLGTPDAVSDFFDWTMGQGIGGVIHVVGLRNSSGTYVLQVDDRLSGGNPTLFNFNGNVNPQAANVYTLGSSAFRWGKAWVRELDISQTVTGSLTPSLNATYSLGSNLGGRWLKLWTQDADFSGTLDGGTYRVGGTTVIDTSRNATFVNVVASGGAFNSTVTGLTTAYTANGGAFIVNGQGDISAGGSINMAGGTGLAPYLVNGTAVIDSNRYFLGPLNTPVGGLVSNVWIGSTGNFYTRSTGASTGIVCAGVSDGWLAVTSDDFVVVCLGGARFRAALSAF